MQTGFHCQDGLFFERKEEGPPVIGGAVEVRVVENDVVVFSTTMPWNVWCSVVASVSRGGEDAERFCRARHFHQGDCFRG